MATKGMGTKFNIGAEGSKKTVAELTEIGGMELSADTIEVTTLDSTDGYREFMQGLKDAGEVSLSGYFNPTTGKDYRRPRRCSGVTSISFPQPYIIYVSTTQIRFRTRC